MYPANSYDGIIQRVYEACWREKNRHMVGIVFSHPGIQLSKNEIIPLLRKYHLRSGKNIHFFFAGYLEHEEGKNDFMQYGDCQEVGGGASAQPWYFSDAAYETIRADIESRSTWRHSGVVDLLLIDAAFLYSMNSYGLDFSQVVHFNLSTAREEKLIPMLPQFFEEIFQFADSENGKSTVWRFSDSRIKSICSAIAEGVIDSLVPNKATFVAKMGKGYAIRSYAID